jgi:hypothetical protein
MNTQEQAFELVKEQFDKRYVSATRNRFNDGWSFSEWDKLIIVYDDNTVNDFSARPRF